MERPQSLWIPSPLICRPLLGNSPLGIQQRVRPYNTPGQQTLAAPTMTVRLVYHGRIPFTPDLHQAMIESGPVLSPVPRRVNTSRCHQ